MAAGIILAMIEQHPPSSIAVAQARLCIDPAFQNSRLLANSGLDERLGLTLLAKDETRNPIGSFKGRGTGFYLAQHPADAPLVTASAGNFGQGLAYNARREGRSVTVFAAESANSRKVEAMRKFGAEVVLRGHDFDAAKDEAKAYAAGRGATFVEDGASASIAEGAGTIAAELTDAFPDLDAILVPLGNGALAVGMGCWARAMSPKTKVIGVAAASAPAMALSWRRSRPVTTENCNTIADGIAVRIPVPAAVAWMAETVDDVWLVDEAEIISAMRLAFFTWGRLVEPAGAAGLAGLLARPGVLGGAKVATVLCGGNLTPDQIAAWVPEATSAVTGT